MRTFLATSMLACLATTAQAQTCRPVHFTHGASSTVLRGTAPFDDPIPCFTLGIRPGQTVSLQVLHPDGNTAFSIIGVVDDQDHYSFRAPSSHVRFSVFETMRAPPTPFELEVAIK